MLDFTVIGNVNRISPKFPVPVIDYSFSEDFLGGRVNVVLTGPVGQDKCGKNILELIDHKNIISEVVYESHLKSIEKKIRIIDN